MRIRSVILIILILLVISISVEATDIHFKSKLEYQTITGEIYREGTGKIILLIFKSTEGKGYLLEGQHLDILKELTGVPLIVTGRLADEKSIMYQGKLEVFQFNTYYRRYMPQLNDVYLYGVGKLSGSGIPVLITPDQKVITLKMAHYSLLDRFENKKVLVKGDLLREGEFAGQMNVKFYKIFESE